MGTILVFPFNILSHYLRCIVFVRRYYPSHKIVFASSIRYNEFVTRAGFDTFDVKHFDADFAMKCSAQFKFDWLNPDSVEAVFFSSRDAINKYKPDLVIGDCAPALKMAAESAGVRYISVLNGYMSSYYSAVRDLPLNHKAHKYLKKISPQWKTAVIRFAEGLAFRKVHAPFRILRKKYRLKYIGSYLQELEGDETFICDDLKLFPQKKLPDNYRVCGPLDYVFNEQQNISLPESPRGLICVCLGSSGNWEDVRFLTDPKYSAYNFILAGNDGARFTGSNFISIPFADLDSILPTCKLLLCHGGNGTIYKGIKHNKFMLCLTTHFEQEYNVQALVNSGLGVHINSNPQKIFDRYLGLIE